MWGTYGGGMEGAVYQQQRKAGRFKSASVKPVFSNASLRDDKIEVEIPQSTDQAWIVNSSSIVPDYPTSSTL